MSLEALAGTYRKAQVPVHRFAFEALASAATSAVAGPSELSAVALSAKAADIDLTEALQALDDTSGNTTFEELECLGLDANLAGGALVASFEVKLSSGYSGHRAAPAAPSTSPSGPTGRTTARSPTSAR